VPFNAVIWPAGAQPLTTNAEIVRVTNRATDTLTITRTQESTSARTVVVGDQIMAAWTAKFATDVAAMGTSAMQLIADGGALAGDGATLADFTSIPATFNHLMVVVQARCDQATGQQGWIRLNNDSAANYDYTISGGTNATSSTATGNAQTQGYMAVIPGTGYTAGQASVATVWLPFYKETTWRKAWTSPFGNTDPTNTNAQTFMATSSWRNTAAVTRITIGIAAGNYKLGSHAMLYGIL
jgi:hypothetical protein